MMAMALPPPVGCRDAAQQAAPTSPGFVRRLIRLLSLAGFRIDIIIKILVLAFAGVRRAWLMYCN